MDNQSLLLAVFDKNVRFVEVQFTNRDEEVAGRHYTYKTDLVLEVGDCVVVETYNWYSVGKVTKTDVPLPYGSTITYRWVVDIVGTEGHMRRLKYEQDVVERINAKRTEGMRARMIEALGFTGDDVLQIMERAVNNDTTA